MQAGRQRSLLTDEHFTVDGTLIEAAGASSSEAQTRPGRRRPGLRFAEIARQSMARD